MPNPNHPKVLGKVLGEMPARNRVLGAVLGKVVVLPVLRRERERRESTFVSTFRSTPFRHVPEQFPEHFCGCSQPLGPKSRESLKTSSQRPRVLPGAQNSGKQKAHKHEKNSRVMLGLRENPKMGLKWVKTWVLTHF